jgi:hypothetical protein
MASNDLNPFPTRLGSKAHTEGRTHIIVIISVKLRYQDQKPKELFQWPGLRTELCIKYRWYFDYRWALLKMKYPKGIMNYCTIVEKVSEEEYEAYELRKAENTWIAAKGQVTKINNAMAKIESDWNEIFSIDTHPKYKRTVEKIQEKQHNLDAAEIRYFSLKKQFLEQDLDKASN